MKKEEIAAMIISTIFGDGDKAPKIPGSCLYEIGQGYLIRTVTFAWTGRIVAITDQEIEISEACCIFDTGRFNLAAKGEWDGNAEHESVEQNVIIGRGSIIDAMALSCPLPRKTK